MIRKITFVFLLLQILSLPIFAQTVLTYSTHAMNEGDMLTLKKLESNSILLGGAGENQIWDYSDLKITGDHVIYYNATNVNADQKTFACDQDGEMTVFYNLSSKYKLYNGITTNGVRIAFEEPIKEMMYPFQYNSQITGKMKGSYTTISTGETEAIDGVYSVTGDAWGSLILPNGLTFKNVLRVKYVKDYSQMLNGNLYHITVNRYLYYGSESRYPIMQVIEESFNCSCSCNSTRYTACFNDNIVPKNDMNDRKGKEKSTISTESFAYEVYPNPFNQELTIDYTIQANEKIKFSVFDLAGKELKILLNTNQLEGAYSISANLGNIPDATYILKMKVGNKSYEERIVKKTK